LRLFVALELPEMLAQQLALMGGGIPGARWEPVEKLHLTVRFLGELEGAVLDETIEALERVRMDRFSLTLSGVGHFPPRGQPRSVWAGVQDAKAVTELHEKIERELEDVDVDPDRRKFAPHVTLARLKGSPERKVAEFLMHHSLFVAPPFDVEWFTLMSSVTSPGGSKYRVEQRFELG
jgi:2'-5' RNA ligase